MPKIVNLNGTRELHRSNVHRGTLPWAAGATKRLLIVFLIPAAAGAPALAGEFPANEWVKLDKASVGTRGNAPLVYASVGKRFLVLGGSISWPEYPKPHPFDELALDLAAGQWENWFPKGKDWGPQLGDAKAPGWKGEGWMLTDREGNTRPNLTTYRGVLTYNQYAWDPETRRAYFFARGSTFCYDPEARAWKDLAPKGSAPCPLWGAMCADPVNKKIMLFGGGSVLTDRGDPGTWAYDPATNAWTELKFASAALDAPGAKAAELHLAAKRLAEQLRARYYRAELAAGKAAKLDEAADKLAAAAALAADLDAAKAKADAQEKLQIGWAVPEVERAKAAAEKLKGMDAGAASVEAIKTADAAREAMAAARDALALQPPQRARSPLVYDADHKQIVLFGGDQLDRLLADTWVFDCASKRWLEKRPAAGPAPRGGHALVYLPRSKRVLLFGGFTYTPTADYCGGQCRNLPFETWLYDPTAGQWEILKRVENAKAAPGSGSPGAVMPAAADENDLVVAMEQLGGYAQTPATWVFRADSPKGDAAATAQFGVKPGTITERKGPFVPAFYDEAPAPDPAEAKLNALAANTWTRLTPPRAPGIDRCWGTAVYSPDHDLIIHWSGGHSSHCGTEVVRYHPGVDRWSLATASELPLEFVYSNDGTPGQWSFKHRPWMTGHTYKSYGYDPVMKRMLFAGRGQLTHVFDPELGDWEVRTIPTPFMGNMYTVTLCSTPKGAVAWAQSLRDSAVTCLWRMNAERAAWEALPLKGKLPGMGPDCQSAVYDSKRDRLLLVASQLKGDVVAYDFVSGEAKALAPAGKEKAGVPSREAVYLPDADAVMVGAHVEGKLWPVYDCEENAWFGAELAGPDPVGKGRFNVSLGLICDPNRKLVWALGQRSEVTVLRFDRGSAQLKELLP